MESELLAVEFEPWSRPSRPASRWPLAGVGSADEKVLYKKAVQSCGCQVMRGKGLGEISVM